MLRLLLAASLSATLAAVCTIGPDTWSSVGTGVPVTISAEDASGAFTASARGAWQDAPGVHFSNGTLFLRDSPAGIWGAVNAACTRIDWADGEGSAWTRPAPRQPKNVTLSNLLPRLDDTGEIMRVQDGCLQSFGGMFYLYGARYQCCPVSEQPACYQTCGWRNATFAVYSSPDLVAWHLESDNLLPIATSPDSPHSNTRTAYFEPCVLYSAAADHYVLWFLTENTKAVAVSDSPTGPFESVDWDTGLAQGSDSYFWRDSDDAAGTYYVKHNGPPPPGEKRGAHYVSQLSPDLLSIVASSPAMMVPALPVPPAFQGSWPSCSEGGGIFKYQGRWYVMAGVCCCFCQKGSNGFVWVSSSGPLGPYALQNTSDALGLLGNVISFNESSGMVRFFFAFFVLAFSFALYPGPCHALTIRTVPWPLPRSLRSPLSSPPSPAPPLPCQYLTGAQQFSVAQVPLWGGGEPMPMYIGQRFGSADDGLKCHDYQYWSPMVVGQDGVVAEMAWVNEFTVQLSVPVS